VSRTARGFTVRRLRHLLSRVAQTDAKLKSSRLDESVWMESLIFDLCRSR
jgi:DNA polymerase III delta subunit